MALGDRKIRKNLLLIGIKQVLLSFTAYPQQVRLNN